MGRVGVVLAVFWFLVFLLSCFGVFAWQGKSWWIMQVGCVWYKILC